MSNHHPRGLKRRCASWEEFRTPTPPMTSLLNIAWVHSRHDESQSNGFQPIVVPLADCREPKVLLLRPEPRNCSRELAYGAVENETIDAGRPDAYSSTLPPEQCLTQRIEGQSLPMVASCDSGLFSLDASLGGGLTTRSLSRLSGRLSSLGMLGRRSAVETPPGAEAFGEMPAGVLHAPSRGHIRALLTRATVFPDFS